MIRKRLIPRYLRKLSLFAWGILSALVVLLTGITEPVLIDSAVNGWKGNIENQLNERIDEALDFFNERQTGLVSESRKLALKFASSDFSAVTGEEVSEATSEKYGFILTKDNEPVIWNSNFFSPEEIGSMLKKHRPDNTFFEISDLFTALVIISDSIGGRPDNRLITFQILEKEYNITETYISEPGFKSQLSSLLMTETEIDYLPYKPKTKDGRKASFELLNNHGEKIGLVTIDKPMLKNELKTIQQRISLVQAFFTIFASLLFAAGIIGETKKLKSLHLRTAIYLAVIFGFRYILIFFDLPQKFISGWINDPSVFSSKLLSGAFRSPLELALSVTAIFFSSVIITRYIGRIKEELPSWHPAIRITAGFISILVINFIVRGYAAALRSVIFDSSLNYFGGSDIVPAKEIIFMNINLILFSVASFLLVSGLLKFLYHMTVTSREKETGQLMIVSGLILIISLIFYFMQNAPLINVYQHILFMILAAVIEIIYRKRGSFNISYFLILPVFSSVFGISVLNYFNTDLEKESLKKTTYNLTRINEGYLSFLLLQTASEIATDKKVKFAVQNKNISDREAFALWSKSPLFGEGISGAITLYDKNKERGGEFFTGNPDYYGILTAAPDFDQDGAVRSLNDKNRSAVHLSVTSGVEDRGRIIGYVNVSATLDYFNKSSGFIPEIFAGKNDLEENEAFSPDIFFIFEDTVINYQGKFSPGREELSTIFASLSEGVSENWVYLTRGGENVTVFASLSMRGGKPCIIATAAKSRAFEWSYFNFFKLFIIHFLFITVIYIIILVLRLRKDIRPLYSFRFRLLGALLVISILPILALAVFNRSEVMNKEKEFIKTRLIQKFSTIENSLNYFSKLYPAPYEVFENIKNSTDADFIIYRGKEVWYMSSSSFNLSGLQGSLISYNAYRMLKSDNQEYFTEAGIENYNYYKYYRQIKFRGENLILSTDDSSFRKGAAFSSLEFDVFLFGIYSFAVMLIFMVSTFIANSIYKPIKTLTSATKSIAHGDLDYKINETDRSEIGELISGFNKMTLEIRKNQEEIASLERETAWKEIARQVAHEIKNPLTPIKLSIQHLLSAYHNKPEKFESVFNKVMTTVLNQIETLNQIASEFSRFAKMPAIDVKPVNLTDVLKEIQVLYSEQNQNIVFGEEKPYIVSADESNLRRIIINLVRNAIQASSTAVSFSISENSGFVTLSIRDNGHGIKEEFRNKIFLADFTTKETGMGLGLKIVKKYMEKIGGDIELVSTGESGSEFALKFRKFSS
ncbi:MAG: ATP-binding protein [Ignavibacteriaceae bacterium]|nr:ATP-binding protein [Ignavibacteriaceae bacterium]